MRIALISEHASPLAVIGGADAGGQNVHVAALATHLGAMGHEVRVYTRRDARHLPAHTWMAPNVRVDHVDAGPPVPVPKDDLPPHMPAFAEQLAEAWSLWRPHVVHAHFWMSGMATLPVARDQDVPMVQTFHALGSVKRRYQGLADTSPRYRLEEERRIAGSVDRVLATCTDEIAELCRLGVPLERTSVVPCGVDLERFSPDGPRASRRPGHARLLSVGRLVPRKGVDDVIRALAAVPHAELVVAGGPEPDDIDSDPEVVRLRDIAQHHGVADRVVFLGSVSRQDVPDLIRSADAVVSYPWYEPFGIVPLEAMACGVPVVVSDVGGMRDTVRHGVTGLRVKPRSPSLLADGLQRLLASPAVRAEMGRAGVERVRRRYGWSRVAAMTAEVYAQLPNTLARQEVV